MAAARPSRADKRALITDAAVEVFAEKGFHLARVSDIAKRAGVADGTIYLYFKNKEDLLLTIFEEKMDFLLKNKACRDEMGAKARRHAAQFAWPLIVDEMMALYAELLQPQLAPLG